MVKDYAQLPQDEILAMRKLNESDWQKRYFVPLFQQLGWHGVHSVDSRTAFASRNALGTRDSALDWMLVRDRVIHVELKREGGYPTEGQKSTIDWLLEADAEVYLWYPRHWNQIVPILIRDIRKADTP
jgi:hypothetical protein